MNTTFGIGNPPNLIRRHEESVVALIGFRTRVGRAAAGLFARCELLILDLRTLDEASRSLEVIAPDAVVVDGHNPSLKDLSGSTLQLLRTLRTRHQETGRQIPLIFLNSAGVSRELRTALAEAGAIVLAGRHSSYRHLIRLVRRLCGLPESCCAIELPQKVLT